MLLLSKVERKDENLGFMQKVGKGTFKALSLVRRDLLTDGGLECSQGC